MLGKLKKLVLGETAYADTAASPEERQQLALAALLVEVARADFDETDGEQQQIIDLLARHFSLTGEEAGGLLNRAQTALEESVCLFDFTRALHNSFDAAQKTEVIRLLWEVALADDHLCKYEDYLIRKVADLLYVPHSDVVKIKHEVADGRR